MKTLRLDTPLEDAILARWERGEFTNEERIWAQRFRRTKEKPLDFTIYIDQMSRAGLPFSPPRTDAE